MSLTPTPLYCPECGCQQIEVHKSYTVKAGNVRQLYYCPDCKGYCSVNLQTDIKLVL
jgi:transposase-like protein